MLFTRPEFSEDFRKELLKKAEDGDAEAQFEICRRIMDDAEIAETYNVEVKAIALYWCIKAALRGHATAVKWIDNHLGSGFLQNDPDELPTLIFVNEIGITTKWLNDIALHIFYYAVHPNKPKDSEVKNYIFRRFCAVAKRGSEGAIIYLIEMYRCSKLDKDQLVELEKIFAGYAEDKSIIAIPALSVLYLFSDCKKSQELMKTYLGLLKGDSEDAMMNYSKLFIDVINVNCGNKCNNIKYGMPLFEEKGRFRSFSLPGTSGINDYPIFTYMESGDKGNECGFSLGNKYLCYRNDGDTSATGISLESKSLNEARVIGDSIVIDNNRKIVIKKIPDNYREPICNLIKAFQSIAEQL